MKFGLPSTIRTCDLRLRRARAYFLQAAVIGRKRTIDPQKKKPPLGMALVTILVTRVLYCYKPLYYLLTWRRRDPLCITPVMSVNVYQTLYIFGLEGNTVQQCLSTSSKIYTLMVGKLVGKYES